MLWRVLKEVQRGTYIDIDFRPSAPGDATRAFFERGWRGIHTRADNAGVKTLLSTFPGDAVLPWDPRRTDGGGASISSIRQLWLHVEPGESIHLMRISGSAETVTEILPTNDWARLRPWIVMVVCPHHLGPARSVWHGPLQKYGYDFAYSDGTNHIYVVREHEDHISAFRDPPNAFDAFVPSTVMNANSSDSTSSLSATQQSLLELEVEKLREEVSLHRARAEAAQSLLREIKSSRSWRITQPIRWTAKQVRDIRGHDARPAAMAKRLLKKIGSRGIVFLRRRPGIKDFVVRVLRVLGLHEFFYSIYQRVQEGAQLQATLSSSSKLQAYEASQVTPAARAIYSELKAAIATARKETT